MSSDKACDHFRALAPLTVACARSGNQSRWQLLTHVALGSLAVFGPMPALAQTGADDIIVTATRRETTLQETPMAVSVVSSDAILKRNLVRMDDYLASVPGVSFQDRGPGANTITIRGIGLGNQLEPNTPTSSYFGEVPTTGLGTTLNGNQAGNADVQMIDIARVEVLRGPQGTLYGSGSLGGTVRVIPEAPNLAELEGKAFAEYSNTARRGGNNYAFNGVVNLPIVTDKLAVRVVGYYIHNDGYIDNVAASQPTAAITAAVAAGALARDQKGVGSDTTYGGRASLLWRPIDGFSVSLTQLYQEIKQDGRAEVETNVSATDYLQVRPRVGTAGNSGEYVNSSLSISNLMLQYDWSWGSIMNSSSYVNSKGTSEIALSFLGGPFVGVGAGPNKNWKDVWINETRFSSKWDFPVQLIAGFYYEDRTVETATQIRWNGTGATPPGAITNNPFNVNKQRQYAAFGEVSYTPWEPFTVTVGARYYNFKQSIPVSLTQTSPTVIVNTGSQGRSASNDGVNWKINAQYKVNDEIFLYGQWAQGFREPRFQNPLDPIYDRDGNGLYEFRDGTQRLPQAGLLNPDRVETYEGGVKFLSASGKFRGSLTGFYTNWSGIPVSILTTYLGAGYFFNAGKATSKGIEFEISGELPGKVFAQFQTSWVESRLGNDPESLSLTGGVLNARLPGSPDHNIYASLEKRFDFGENEGFIRGDWTYVSQYLSVITQSGFAGDYHQFGLSAGVSLGNVNVGVFAKNVTNSDNFTWIDNTLASGRAYRLRPRTIGVNVSMKL